MPQTVHLVFKTHLDIGFTDYAAQVVRTYHEQFIPGALHLAAQTRDTAHRFRWTVGAWLIDDHLEQATPEGRRLMEQAIAAGDIVWHALPFTTHTELMDASLFQFGLSYARRLDARFGRTTLAGKMTDVPGHTRSMVPLLHDAGVRLLHIGLNPVAAVPDVPPVFLWRDADSDTSLCVIYDQTYGGVTQVEGMDDILAVILTSDNEGPPPVHDVEQQYAALRERFPMAQVVASTLDDYAGALWATRDRLPVVTAEIGDTWIHGAGTDPAKVARYRELSRLRRRWLDRDLSAADHAAVEAFSRRLIMVPEHTWGMDEKTHLPDHDHYTREELAALRREPRTQAFEQSWVEQRNYLTAAVAALADTPLADEANDALAALIPTPLTLAGLTPVASLTLASDRCQVTIDATSGAVSGWTDAVSGIVAATEAQPLAALSYTVYGREDYERYWQQYVRDGDTPANARWAREDNTKIGMPTDRARTWTPTVSGLYQLDATRSVVALTFPAAARQFGAPELVTLAYALAGDTLSLELRWHGKPANRIAEAFWLAFTPANVDPASWRFEKMGRRIDPRDVVSKGARTLHAVDQRITCDRLTLTTVDAPLVASRQPSLLNFTDTVPDMRGGVHVCLYNNIWGTNFPMWYEDDALFRFALRLHPAE